MAEGLLKQDRALERVDDISEVNSVFLLWNMYHKVGQKLRSKKHLAFHLEILPQSSVRNFFWRGNVHKGEVGHTGHLFQNHSCYALFSSL